MSNQEHSLFLNLSNYSGLPKKEIFNCTQHANNVSQKLRSYYERKEFCDIVLVSCDNVKLQAHRIVLSASSDLFVEIFRNKSTQIPNSDELQFQGINGVYMKMILDYVYTGSIELRTESVECILRTASYLKIELLADACCNFVAQHLNFDNCIDFALFAQKKSYFNLFEKSYAFVCSQFDQGNDIVPEVLPEPELPSPCYFDRIIENNGELTMSTFCIQPQPVEPKVIVTPVAWIENHPEDPEKMILNFPKAKFTIDDREMVCKTIECYDMLCNWLQGYILPEPRSLYSIRQPKPVNVNKLNLIYKPPEYFLVPTFNAETRQWSYEQWPCSPTKREDFGSGIVNDHLVYAGGTIEGIPTNIVECLGLQSRAWVVLPPMKTVRSRPGVAQVGRCLYVVGGFNGVQWLNTVEKYSFVTRTWQEVPPMNQVFENVEVSTHGGVLFATGDFYFERECFNPETNQWSSFQGPIPILKKRLRLGA